MIAVVAGGNQRTAPALVQANGTVTGTQTNTVGGGAIAGGTVQLLLLGAVISTATPNGSGVYSFSNVPAGSYTVFNQPPAGYGIGDAGTFSISVSGGATTTQNLLVTAAVYYTDLQSFTTAQLVSVANPLASGDFGYNAGNTAYQTNGWGGHYTNITMDTTGVPAPYSKAGLYTIPTHNVNAPYSPANLVLSVRPFGVAGYTSIAWRLTEYCDAGFDNGGGGVTGAARQYKHMLCQIGPVTGSGYGQIGVYMQQNANGGTRLLSMDSTDKIGNTINSTLAGSTVYPVGQWNTVVMLATGLGSSSTVISLYLNGVLQQQWSGSYQPGLGQLGLGGSDNFWINPGEQFNNGPDQGQTRWFREIGIYASRPSLLAL